MKLLITGGCGFLGSNLAAEALRRSDELCVVDNLSRSGSEQNAAWLQTLGKVRFERMDTRDRAAIEELIRTWKPDACFHLAGQVAMTTSLADPRLDFEVNVMGGHNVLESFRKHRPEAAILYSSTNKVYGDLEYIPFEEMPRRYLAKGYERGFDENVRLDFRSPYGCSKGAMDQYMLDYARMFNLKTIVFRHSSIFGDRQFSTYDQGWIGWFVSKALERKAGNTEPFTISGTGKQVRDVLFSSDLVRLYFGALEALGKNESQVRGQAFNIGGGIENSLSLLELFDSLEAELGVQLKYKQLPWRQSDQKVFVADIRKAEERIGWHPQITSAEGLRRMISWTKTYAKYGN